MNQGCCTVWHGGGRFGGVELLLTGALWRFHYRMWPDADALVEMEAFGCSYFVDGAPCHCRRRHIRFHLVSTEALRPHHHYC